jgi:hypothetical protein
VLANPLRNLSLPKLLNLLREWQRLVPANPPRSLWRLVLANPSCMDLRHSLVGPGPLGSPDQIFPFNPMERYVVRLVILCLYKSEDRNEMAHCAFSTALAFAIVAPVLSECSVKNR